MESKFGNLSKMDTIPSTLPADPGGKKAYVENAKALNSNARGLSDLEFTKVMSIKTPRRCGTNSLASMKEMKRSRRLSPKPLESSLNVSR